MIKALKKLADIDLKRKISLFQSQYNDEEFSIGELEQLIYTSFQEFSNDFNALATTHNIDIKLIINPTNEEKFTIIENEEELYRKSQIDSTHALREEEYIPTMGKQQEDIKLFVSYSRKDKEDVELLISEIEKTPYPFVFWKDDRNLLSGEDFKGDIQQAIKECDFGLLMVSENFESEFIVEHELPHFLEMRSSEISKTKASVPIFINSKSTAIAKLRYINDETLIFSHKDRGFIESRNRDEFVKALISEIFKRFEKEKEKEKQATAQLLNNSEIKELTRDFIPTKAEYGIDIVKEIKEWSNIVVKNTAFQLKNIEENINRIKGKIKNEEAELERIKDRIKSKNKQDKIGKRKISKQDRKKEKEYDKSVKNMHIQKIKELYKEKEPFEFRFNKLNTRKNNSKYFALLGDSGMGKTWSCMKIALELQEEDSSLNPIYLDLRHFASSEAIHKEFDWQEIIDIVIRKSLSSFKKDMSVNTVFDIIKRGEAFVIFDGLDEVTVHLEDDRRANAFIRELKKVVFLNENNKILFSCRTHYFRTIQEQFSMLSGQDRERIQNKDFMSLELLPFTWEQIEDYCKKNGIDFFIFKNIVTTIHNLVEVSQRPYSLKLITLQIRELEEAIKEGREVNSADIYLGIIESSLNRDSGKHTLSKIHKPIIMQELSAYMWSQEVRSLEYYKLDEWFDKWLYENKYIERCYHNESREKLKSDLRGATFMVRPNTNVFRFSHTSLQEFFLAQYLFKALEKKEFDKFEMKIPSTETIEFFVMLWKRDVNRERLMDNFNELITSNSHFAFEIYLIAYRLELEIDRKEPFILENLDFSERIFYSLENNFLDLQNSKFININFDKVVFEYINFKNSKFEFSRFLGSKWLSSNFSFVTFNKCVIKLADYDLSSLDIKGVNYIQSPLL